MIQLLHKCTRHGYPAEYLLTRIRARMQMGAAKPRGNRNAGSSLHGLDAEIWNVAENERKWIYMQTERDLRESLAPLLLYFELNTLVYCLRSMRKGVHDSIGTVIENSLLTSQLKKIVLSMATRGEVVERLERFLTNSAFVIDGLSIAYNEGGMQRCEELIRRKFLEQVSETCIQPEVKNFFRSIIDQKNTMTMAKCLRWKKVEAPAYIQGGHVRLRRTDKFPSPSGVERMVRHCAPGLELNNEDLDPVNLGPLLNNHMSQNLIRHMRNGSPVMCCMGYVWHCFVNSREESQKLHTIRFAENFHSKNEVVQ